MDILHKLKKNNEPQAVAKAQSLYEISLSFVSSIGTCFHFNALLFVLIGNHHAHQQKRGAVSTPLILECEDHYPANESIEVII